EFLGQVLGLIGREALPADEGVEGIPIAGTQAGERVLSLRRIAILGGDDQAPMGSGKATWSYWGRIRIGAIGRHGRILMRRLKAGQKSRSFFGLEPWLPNSFLERFAKKLFEFDLRLVEVFSEFFPRRRVERLHDRLCPTIHLLKGLVQRLFCLFAIHFFQHVVDDFPITHRMPPKVFGSAESSSSLAPRSTDHPPHPAPPLNNLP